MAIEGHNNAKLMLEIRVESISAVGSIMASLIHYLDELKKVETGESPEVDDAQMALDILHQVDKFGKKLTLIRN